MCAQKDESLNPGWTLPKGPSRPKAVSTAATQRGEWGPCSVCRVHRANPQGTGIPQVPLPLRSPIQRPLPSRLPSDSACSCAQEATGAGHLLLQVYRQPRHTPLPLRGHFQIDTNRRRAEGRLAAFKRLHLPAEQYLRMCWEANVLYFWGPGSFMTRWTVVSPST